MSLWLIGKFAQHHLIYQRSIRVAASQAALKKKRNPRVNPKHLTCAISILSVLQQRDNDNNIR